MHDFFYVRSVDEVIAYLQSLPPLPDEIALLDAPQGLEGRVLAADVMARDDVPLSSRCAMDGFAVCAADTFGASESNPVYLTCIGHCAIDAQVQQALVPGQCLGVVTGGILPQGADAVVMVEHTYTMRHDCIEVRRPAPPGAYVLLRGEDARAHTVALPAGTVLRPQELGLLAATGTVQIPVYRRPVAAIVSTGDEVIPAHASPRLGQVRDVNSHTLAALLRQAGAVPQLCGIVPDNLDCLEDALRTALAVADVVFISGGSSVGVRDLTLAALRRLAHCTIYCHGVALSPGKPLIIAQVGNKTVWGLPGQVASAQVVMMVLGKPFMRHLAGQNTSFDQRRWPLVRARLTRNVASCQGREDYIRIRLEADSQGDVPLAVPVLGMSGLLRTLLDSHGVCRISASLEGLEQGSIVDVLLFE